MVPKTHNSFYPLLSSSDPAYDRTYSFTCTVSNLYSKQKSVWCRVSSYILFKCLMRVNKHCTETFVVHGIHYLHLYMLDENCPFK